MPVRDLVSLERRQLQGLTPLPFPPGIIEPELFTVLTFHNSQIIGRSDLDNPRVLHPPHGPEASLELLLLLPDSLARFVRKLLVLVLVFLAIARTSIVVRIVPRAAGIETKIS
ncbi:hypothetical protein Mapa_014084 [Marchantia paleacea]|nr:hypothetical protein Mapa_014084 [Marchantia paleacea]